MLKKVNANAYVTEDGSWAVNRQIGIVREIGGLWKVRKVGTTYVKYADSLKEAREIISAGRSDDTIQFAAFRKAVRQA